MSAEPTSGDLFTLHLCTMPSRRTLALLSRPPRPGQVDGLTFAECFTHMRLGAPVVSTGRSQLTKVAVVARWDSEAALEAFLSGSRQGEWLSAGWHVRMKYLRRWSTLAALPDLPVRADRWDSAEPVVAVTVARMRLLELPRFLKWGRPVERQVRDDPGTTLALAGVRVPRTVATFTVWRSVQQMTDMVHGRGGGVLDDDAPRRRHVAAMGERDRRDFHHEFSTMRFRPLSEHGSFEGRTSIIPWR